MTLGPVRVMGVGVAVMMCVEEVANVCVSYGVNVINKIMVSF